MSQNGHTSHIAARLHTTASAAGGSLGMLGHNPRSTALNNRNNNNSNMNHTNSSSAAASWSASQVDANQNNVAGLAATHHHPGAAPGTPSGGDYEAKETVHPAHESSSSSQSGNTLKEHDLLGLSDVSSSVTRQENSAQDSSFQSEGINLNLNLGATELRLGLQDARKADSEFQRQRSGVVGTPEQGTSSASETGNFLGGLDGGKGNDQGALVSDRRSSNSDQYTAISEQQQQQVLERRFSYGPLTGERGPPTPKGGRADALEGTACKPLIDSESLQKWHGGVERNMVPNESLRLGMSLLQSKRSLNQEDVTEQLFFNSADRNYQDNTPQELKQHQHQLVSEEHHHPLGYQDRSWQERNQHNLCQQEDVSSAERVGTQERPMSDRGPPSLDQQQQVGEKGEQQDRLKHEPFHTEKRNLQDGSRTLAALQQQPEPRFVQELSSSLPERSPRHASDYVIPPKLWQSQGLRPAEFHTQQHPAQQEDSSRTGYPGPLGGGFPGPGSRVVFGTSKPGVSGAKRSFDTIGISSDARNFNDSRAGLPSPVTGTSAVVPSNSSSSDADVKSKSQQPPLYQSWVTKATPPWQMLQHSGGSFGPFPSQAPGRNPAMPVMNNHPTAEAASAGGDPAQKAWEAQTKGLQEPAASSLPQKMSSCPSETKPSAAQASSPATEAVSAPRAAATPAVGWPPLRSFRKSTLASQNRPSPVETNPRPPPPSSTQAASPASVASQPNSYFVKVYMDGVPIGRKVDLKAYSSYEKLSLVLEDMFRGFVNGQQSGQGARDMTTLSDKRSFFRGTDYVLTYEDQEGDLMLVGDVPWMLFLETVKRLRIMKGSEAIGLGSRAGTRVAAEKVNKAQHSV